MALFSYKFRLRAKSFIYVIAWQHGPMSKLQTIIHLNGTIIYLVSFVINSFALLIYPQGV